MSSPLSPRAITRDVELAPGMIFFECSNGWAGRLIRIGTRSDVNHVGVYVGPGKAPGTWSVVEAQPDLGLALRDRKAPEGYVFDPCDDSPVATQLVAHVALAYAERGLGYDWWSIAALGVKIVSRFPGLCWLRGLRAPLLKRSARTERVICSDATRQILEAVIGPLDLPFPSHTTSPEDLRQAFLGRKLW